MDTTIEIAPEINETGRAELIEEISTLTAIRMVDSATWSCLWFSDMERLQELVDAVHESRTGLTTNLIINLLVGSQSVQALRSCKCQLFLSYYQKYISFVNNNLVFRDCARQKKERR